MSTEIGNNTKEPLDETLSIGNTTANGQQIEAENGGGLLDLRFGTDGLVVLTNDASGLNSALSLNKVSKVVQISQSDGLGGALFYAEITDSLCAFRHSGADAFSCINPSDIQHSNVSNSFPTSTYAISVFSTILPRTSNGGDNAVFINSGNSPDVSTFNAGVERSVILGGRGLTAKTDDTAYVNQISFQFVGNTFDLMVRGSLATADRTQSLQDDSGTIALLKNIAVSQFAVNLDSAEATVTRVFAGGRTTFTVTHPANSLDIKPEIFRLADGRTIEWRIERTSTSTVECSRAGNVADGLFRFLI